MSRSPLGLRNGRKCRRFRPSVQSLESRELLTVMVGDGSFEAAVVGNGNFVYGPSGTPWTFSGTAGVTGNNSSFASARQNAPDGQQAAFIQQAGSISQQVSGWTAGSYHVTFAAAQIYNSNQDFQVLVDGSVVATFQPQTATSYLYYTTPSFTVAAGDHTITLQGIDSSGGDDVVLVDSVVVFPATPGVPVVNDPSFEQAPVAPGSYAYNPQDSYWDFQGSSGVSSDNSAFTSSNPPSPNGTHVAFIQGGSSLIQTVVDWSTGSYQVSLSVAQCGVGDQSGEGIQVLLDGAVVGSIMPSSTSYQTYTTPNFPVTAGSHALSFRGLDASGKGNTVLIDGVGVGEVSGGDGFNPPPAPVITSPASASPSDVTGTTTQLSVGASVDGDASSLIYSWAVTAKPDGSFNPQLSDNNSNSASNITATFTSAGNYTFLVTVDNDGSYAFSEVMVTVEQTVSRIAVSPPIAFVYTFNSQQMTAIAYDQFGQAMRQQPSFSWSLQSGGSGSISSTGLYSPPDNLSNQDTVNAFADGIMSNTKIFTKKFPILDFMRYSTSPPKIITNQFAGVNFSTDPGFFAYDQSFPGYVGYVLEPAPYIPVGGQGTPKLGNLYVDFEEPVDNLVFSASSFSGMAVNGQVRIFQSGSYSTTVDLNPLHSPYLGTRLDLSAYKNITRIEITNGSSNVFGYFSFDPNVVNLTAHRTGDHQGQVVTDAVKASGDPSKYVVLTDNSYVQADGTPALASNTADIPGSGSGVSPINPAQTTSNGGTGDTDLAQITLSQLPPGRTDGKMTIVLSDPTTVRLFKSDGSLLYADGVTDSGALTLDLSNPSGYLAGLRSGDINIWVEGVHQAPDFHFSLHYEDKYGDSFVSDEIRMDIADWSFRSYDGTPLDAVQPVWGSALLAEVQQASSLGVQGSVNEVPEDFFYKNLIMGLATTIQANLKVSSDGDQTDTYVDDLRNFSNGLVSNHFAALYGSEEILGADPDPAFTADQRQQILNILGLNVVHNPAASSTFTLGPADNPTDSFTRKLPIKPDLKIAMNNASGIYNAGDHITGAVSGDNGSGWNFTVNLLDFQGKVVKTVKGNNPTSFDFVADQPGYYTLAVAGLDSETRMLIAMARGDGPAATKALDLITPFNSILLDVLPAGQPANPWQMQAWQALQGNSGVPGDPINRNRLISSLYAQMYNDPSQNLKGPDGQTVFKWSGMAALASQLVGSGMAKAQAVVDAPIVGTASVLQIVPEPAKGIQLLSQGNLDVFMDMYPQMLAYKSGAMTEIQKMLDNNQIQLAQFQAWQQISQGQQTGNQQLVWDGNQALLRYEQRFTLQNGAYIADLAYFNKVTNSQIPLTNTQIPMIPALTSPIPGDDSTFQSFRATTNVKDQDGNPIASNVSVGDFNARWAWIIQKQLPVYQNTWSVANPTIDVRKLLSGGYK